MLAAAIAYRGPRDEYAEIRELRRKNWLAAHIRERRYELELTQKEVADRADTSYSFISSSSAASTFPRSRSSRSGGYLRA